MNELVEELKKDFNGSADYMSGVNDGMYHLVEKLREIPSCPHCGEPRSKSYQGEGSCERCAL